MVGKGKKGGKPAAAAAPAAAKGKKEKGPLMSDEDDEAEEVRESQWLGKALRRQNVREEQEDKASAKKSGKPRKAQKLAIEGLEFEAGDLSDDAEDDSDEANDDREELGGTFSFDADDSIDQLAVGWRTNSEALGVLYPGSIGLYWTPNAKIRHKADPKGVVTSMSAKIAKRTGKIEEEEEEEGESEGEEGNESDGGSGQSHISDDDDSDDVGARPGEHEDDEEEGGADEDEDDDEDDGENDEIEEDEKGQKGAEKRRRREEAARQREKEERAEREAAYFDDAPVPAAASNSFPALHLSRPLLKAVTAMGFNSPTAIQSMVIPVALQGKDICASARTGSGKTAAFSLPFLERLLYRPRRVPATRVLVLTPTRELAVQAHTMMERLAQFTDIRCYIVIGGVSNKLQEVELRKKPDVVVATPGRMIDHLRNSPGVGIEGLEILVLDEADRLLEMGFTEEVQEVVKMCPIARQTMLFSATMTHDVDQLAAYSLKRPVRVTADGSIRSEADGGSLNKVAVPAKLQQEFVRIRKEHETDREALLIALCKRSFKSQTIVFAREKRRCHRLRILFGLAGLKAEELHGNLTQAQRIDSLESFREGKVDFLLATDLAGRGLDIKNVEAVINFEVPRNLADYVHRVGRTARAGRAGKAVTLADDSARTKKMLKEIVRGAPGVVKRRVVPPEAVDAMRAKIEDWEEEIDAIIEEEKVERQMRIADMETDKARNMVEYEEDIKSRPKKSWFQTNQEKREVRERNPASGRALEGGGSKRKAEEDEEDEEESAAPQISKKKVLTGKKEDKYAGMSRAKRRRVQMQEMDELEAARDKALASHAKMGEDMFASEAGAGRKQKKPLSQKAAKAAVRKGRLDIDRQKQDARQARKNKRRDARREKQSRDAPSSKGKHDGDLFKEAVAKELASTGRKPTATKKNKKQGKATHHAFKSKKRMKRH